MVFLHLLLHPASDALAQKETKVVNNGDLPAVNVKMKYSIIIKKAVFDYGIDEADIINEHFIEYKTIVRNALFIYIPARSEVVEEVLYLTGDFCYADLILHKLKSDERTFINNSIKIDVYEHPDFSEIADSHHLRKVLGVYKGSN